jgi:hypothetical protein
VTSILRCYGKFERKLLPVLPYYSGIGYSRCCNNQHLNDLRKLQFT